MKWISAALPLLLGAAAFKWTPLQVWIDMNQGLIAFLGFLCAALIQVIPVTANFLQSDRLTPDEATKLSNSLAKQQRYWLGLLGVSIGALIIIVVVSAMKDRTLFETPAVGSLLLAHQINVAPLLSGLVAASVSFVLIKMIAIFPGVMSLHTLRSDLVIANAKRQAAHDAEVAQQTANLPMPLVPDNYGAFIEPPKH